MSGSALPKMPIAKLDASELREGGVFEMANLTEAQTGVPGIVYVSTEEGGHGPRVKYSVRAGRSQPSYSISIAERPRCW